MDLLGIGVQQFDGCNLFLLNHQISSNQMLLLSREFFIFNCHLRSSDLSSIGPKSNPPNFKSGSAVLHQQYRVLYTLISDVYVFIIISDDHGNPYTFVPTLTRAKRALISACKGTDISAAQLTRKFIEVYVALERVLHGEDASEPISQKILESTPFAPGPPTIGFNICGKLFDGSSGIPFRGPLPVLTIPDEPKQVEPDEVKSNPRQFFTYNPRRSSVSSKTLHADQASPYYQNPLVKSQ